MFIGRTDVEAETPILWPLMRRADSLEKTLMLGKIEGWRKVAEAEFSRLEITWKLKDTCSLEEKL